MERNPKSANQGKRGSAYPWRLWQQNLTVVGDVSEMIG
jgi:hypothetical protein